MGTFLKIVGLAQKIVKFVESPEGQKLVADLKAAGAEILKDIKALEVDAVDVEKALQGK